MASVLDLVSFVTVSRSSLPLSSSSVRIPSSAFHSSSSLAKFRWAGNGGKRLSCRRNGGKSRSFGVCRAMAQETVQGASANYAKKMERLSAKESLLLAFKDSGGFESLITGKTTDVQRIDVNERITGLEKLNPTPRPTTSPFFEGRWKYEWLGTGNPILTASQFIFERSPSSIASLLSMDVIIKDGYAKVMANMKFLNSIEKTFVLTTNLSVEGPLRIKEELKIPLSGAFQRLYMISYLDEEILIMRDTTGVPEVLTRLDAPASLQGVESVPEYES